MRWTPRSEFGSMVLVAASLSGCTYNIDVTIPQSGLPAYMSCLATARGVCSAPQTQREAFDLFAASATGSSADAAPPAAPISTSPPASFENPFRAAQKTNDNFTSTFVASTAGAHHVDRSQPVSAPLMAEGVDAALDVLRHPFQAQMNKLHAGLSSPAGGPSDVLIATDDVRTYVQLVTKVSTINGWSAYRSAAIYNYVASGGTSATTEDVRRAIFLEGYVKAYFRNGEFGDVEFKADDLFKTFPDLDKLPDPLKKQLKDEIAKLQKSAVFGKIGTAGFVTRAGTTYQMPPLQLAVDPTKKKVVTISKVDYPAVGADLVRVVLEAMFDAHDVLPAVANATGVKANLKNVVLPADFDGLDVFGSATSPLTQDQFDQVAAISNSIEGGATVAVSEIIRGIGPAGLNNEAIAQVIETAVGAAARKVAEKGTYCWYSCKLDQWAPRSIPDVAGSALRGNATTVHVKVKY